MSSKNAGNLSGRTVVVTRARAQAQELATLLEAAGAKVLECPTIAIVPRQDLPELDAALAHIEEYDAVILGSRNAAEILFDRTPVPLATTLYACVGAKTGAYIKTRGARLILAPPEYHAEALVAALERELEWMEGRRFLFPRAPEGREVLIDRLREKGAEVEAIEVYGIADAPPPLPELCVRLEKADIFTFLSGETLRAFLAIVPDGAALLSRAKVAVIGPIAAARAAELGVRVDVVPKAATIEALVEALAVC